MKLKKKNARALRNMSKRVNISNINVIKQICSRTSAQIRKLDLWYPSPNFFKGK